MRRGILIIQTSWMAGGSSFAAFAPDFFRVPRRRLTTVKTIADILPQLFEPGRTNPILFFHETQSLADNFAR